MTHSADLPFLVNDFEDLKVWDHYGCRAFENLGEIHIFALAFPEMLLWVWDHYWKRVETDELRKKYLLKEPIKLFLFFTEDQSTGKKKTEMKS